MTTKILFFLLMTVLLVILTSQTSEAQTCFGVEMALGFRSEALLKQAGRYSMIGTEEAALAIARMISTGEAIPFENEPVQLLQRGPDYVKIKMRSGSTLWTIPNNLDCP